MSKHVGSALLDNVTVNERDGSLPVRVAGTVLAQLGARVVQAGASKKADRSGYLGVGKHSNGSERWPSDIILSSAPAEASEASAICTVSPFGSFGPKSNHQSTELISLHSCGLGYLAPRAYPGEADSGILEPGFCNAEFLTSYAGVHGAAAALVALYGARRRKHAEHVDISVQDLGLPLVRRELSAYLTAGTVAGRMLDTWVRAPAGIRAVADGHVSLTIVEEAQWLAFVRLLGREDIGRDPRFASPELRQQNASELEPIIASMLKDRNKRELSDACQEEGVPIAPCNDISDVWSSRQLRARDFIGVESADTAKRPILSSPIRILATSERIVRGGVNRGGETGPLSSLRILDFGHVWAGPYASQLLAHCGAEVIRIESSRHLDLHRRQPPFFGNPGLNSAGVWLMQNTGKKSVSIDLSKSAGRKLVHRLIAKSDAGFENFSPGVIERLGLGWRDIQEVNPGFILVSINGFGSSGPMHRARAYGPSIEAEAGVCSLVGDPAGPPRGMGGAIPDTVAGTYAAAGCMAAIIARDLDGRGRHLEVSQLEATVSLLADAVAEYEASGKVRTRIGSAHDEMAPHGVYPAQEGEWIAIAVRSDEEWAHLVDVTRIPEWQSRKYRHAFDRISARTDLDAMLRRWTSTRRAEEIEASLQQKGIPATKSMSVRDLLGDPHLQARGAFSLVNHASVGSHLTYSPSWRFESMRLLDAAPCLGQDNDYVLGELLGLTSRQIAQLAEEEVIT